MKRMICIAAALLLALLCSGCNKSFTVTFDPNGGSVTAGEAVQSVSAGEDAVPPEVSREGYAFAGWDGEYISVNGERSVTAKWDKLYTVSFDAGEGTLPGESSFLLREGELPEAPTPERAYYSFAGWSPEIAPAAGDETYTALWEKRTLTAKEIYEFVSPGVVEIHGRDANGTEWIGSGFFINEKGAALTNFHVMVGAAEATAVLADGSEYDITGVFDYDKDLDLCIIKVDIEGNEFLTISEDAPVTGQTVYAIGSPKGYTGTLSNGIVSSASRIENGTDYIQLTAPISSGNSGGPLVNEYGEVLGVNAMQWIDGQNLNFAVNIAQLDELLIRTPTALHFFTAESGTDHLFYTLFPYAEHEPNGVERYADVLENESVISAEITDDADRDYFVVSLQRGETMTIYWLPYNDCPGFEYRFGYMDRGTFIYLDDIEFMDTDDGYIYAEYTANRQRDIYLELFAPEEGIDSPIYYVVAVEIE